MKTNFFTKKKVYAEICTNWLLGNLLPNQIFTHAFLTSFVTEISCRAGIPVTVFSTGKLLDGIDVPKAAVDYDGLITVSNHSLVAEYVIHMLNHKQPISLSIMKDIHTYIMFGPGADDSLKGYRTEPFEDCAWRATEPVDIEKELNTLVDFVNGDNYKDDPLQLAAALICYFANIKPFDDGNLRTAMWLCNYHLALHNHPPIIMLASETRFEEALRMFDATYSHQSMVKLLKEYVEGAQLMYDHLLSEH